MGRARRLWSTRAHAGFVVGGALGLGEIQHAQDGQVRTLVTELLRKYMKSLT